MNPARFCFLFVLWPGLLPAQTLSGVTDWAARVELGTPVAGVIARVEARAGQRFRQGELLLSLDPRPFELRIQALQAKIDKLKILRKEMQAELKRAEELYDRTLLSDHERELARIKAVSADADYRAARSELASARLELEYSRLHAPFDLIVLERQAEKGRVVSPRMKPQTLFVVASSRRMRVLVQVEADMLANLKTGQAVGVTLGGQRFPGRITVPGLRPSADGKGYVLEVEFDTGGSLIRSGQPAGVEL